MAPLSLWMDLGTLYDEAIAARFADVDVAVVVWASSVRDHRRLKRIEQHLVPGRHLGAPKHTCLTIDGGGRACTFTAVEQDFRGPYESFAALFFRGDVDDRTLHDAVAYLITVWRNRQRPKRW